MHFNSSGTSPETWPKEEEEKNLPATPNPRTYKALHRTVLTVRISSSSPRNSPQSLIKLILHLIWYKRGPTQRTRLLIMIHPTVQTAPVENVPAVRQPPDLFLSLEFVETNGAILRHFAGAGSPAEVLILHHGKDFPDQDGGYGWVIRYAGRRFGPWSIRFQEIREAQKVEEGENEISDQTQKGKCVEKDFGKKNLCASDWEAHLQLGHERFFLFYFLICKREREEREREVSIVCAEGFRWRLWGENHWWGRWQCWRSSSFFQVPWLLLWYTLLQSTFPRKTTPSRKCIFKFQGVSWLQRRVFAMCSHLDR